jgi:hypothetical protein
MCKTRRNRSRPTLHFFYNNLGLLSVTADLDLTKCYREMCICSHVKIFHGIVDYKIIFPDGT